MEEYGNVKSLEPKILTFCQSIVLQYFFTKGAFVKKILEH